jgi:HK97 family phage prohead protease
MSMADAKVEAKKIRAEDKDSYILDGMPVVYNRMTTLYGDKEVSFREIILPGAATRALAANEAVLLWNHDASAPMAARKNGTLEVKEEADGIRIHADVSGSRWGRNGHEAIQSGLVDAMSFGFFADRSGYVITRTEEDGKDVITRTIREFSRILDFPQLPTPPIRIPRYQPAGLRISGPRQRP